MENDKSGLPSFYEELLSNENNIYVDFFDEETVLKTIKDICIQQNERGYMVASHLIVSDDIKSHIDFGNNLALLISKRKIKEIYLKHNIVAEDMLKAIKKSVISPEAIIFDSSNGRYLFLVALEKRGYRVVLELDTIPQGIKDIKADVVTTLFREDGFLRRLKKIKKGDFSNLSLLYEVGEGWTALVTQSPSGVFDAVAAASRESSSTFTNSITKGNANVKGAEKKWDN